MPCSRNKLLLMVIITEGVVLILAFSLAKFFGIKLFPLPLKVYRDILLGTIYALFPLALFLFLLLGKTDKIPVIGPFRKIIVTDIKDIFANSKLLDICLFSLLSGFAEEVLFRGVIQVKLGIVASSIIFGLLHFVTPAYCIIATIMGFYLGVLYQYYGSLLIPIQLHFLYNLCALVSLKYLIKTQHPIVYHTNNKF